MQRVKLLEVPLPRTKLLVPYDGPQAKLFVGVKEVTRTPPVQLDLWVDPSVFFHDELTPWFNIVADGPPVRPGVYQTSGDGKTPAFRPWRKYFGSSAWSTSCASPLEAYGKATSSVGRPVYYRGVVRDLCS